MTNEKQNSENVVYDFDICHLASAHERNDTRIGVKMAGSAIAAGYKVAYVVADGKGESSRDGLSIFGTPKPSGRLKRMLLGPIGVYRTALKLNAKIYKLHDPELLLLVPFIKLFSRAKFVFDSHEDVPVQFLNKPYLNPTLRRIGSWFLLHFMNFLCARLNGVIAATPFIRAKLEKANKNAIDICNYPLLSEFPTVTNTSVSRDRVSYVGNIGESRGIYETLEAVDLCRSSFKLDLVGKFSQAETENRAREMPGWDRVVYHGWVGREEVSAALEKSVVGLVTLRPHPNYIDSLPVKLFEYMGAGIPVIASDFPLWRDIVQKAGSGILVDPLEPAAIAKSIDTLVEDKELASKLGKNGRKAVEEKYNWGIEEQKLLTFYKKLLK